MVPIGRPGHQVVCRDCRHFEERTRSCRKTDKLLSGTFDLPRYCDKFAQLRGSSKSGDFRKDSRGIKKGSKVVHCQHGGGVVTSVGEKRICVRFADGVREFPYPATVKRGLLSTCDHGTAIKPTSRMSGEVVSSAEGGAVCTKKGTLLREKGGRLICPRCGYSPDPQSSEKRCPYCKRGSHK